MTNPQQSLAPDVASPLSAAAQLRPAATHDGAQLVLKFGAHPEESWVLSANQPMTMGRAPANDIQLPARLVSRNHAQIRWQDGCFQLEDLGSKNGTYLNGKPVKHPTPLQHGDVCQVATCFKFAFVTAVAPAHDGITRDNGERTVGDARPNRHRTPKAQSQCAVADSARSAN